ncbi:MAG: GDSL-type esterase/lipase family protein [Bacteroidia bacterium]
MFAWLVVYGSSLQAQDPARFNREVAEIAASHRGQTAEVVLLGSSSIKIWSECHACLAEFSVINSGFGGSQTSDLLAHWRVLTVEHNPDLICIYEGDNDLAAGEHPDSIMLEMVQLVGEIRAEWPEIRLFLVGPKPSPSRMHLAEAYQRLNGLMLDYCEQQELGFIDTWNALQVNGEVPQEWFQADRLHLNDAGYARWCEAFRSSLELE